MVVSDFTTSFSAMGSGAAAAMTRRASLVSSAPRSTASTGVRWRSSLAPWVDWSQRRTFSTISSWVSPSKERLAMQEMLPGTVGSEEVTAEGGGAGDEGIGRLPRHEVAAVPEEERAHDAVEHGGRHAVEVGVEDVVRRPEEDERGRVGVAPQHGWLAAGVLVEHALVAAERRAQPGSVGERLGVEVDLVRLRGEGAGVGPEAGRVEGGDVAAAGLRAGQLGGQAVGVGALAQEVVGRLRRRPR